MCIVCSKYVLWSHTSVKFRKLLIYWGFGNDSLYCLDKIRGPWVFFLSKFIHHHKTMFDNQRVLWVVHKNFHLVLSVPRMENYVYQFTWQPLFADWLESFCFEICWSCFLTMFRNHGCFMVALLKRWINKKTLFLNHALFVKRLS